MKIRSASRLSRRTADRLLDGHGGPCELSSLLARAAAPPAGPGPADRETEALAHFRVYAALPRRSAVRPSVLRRIAALSAATKALTVAAVAAAGTTGVALTSNGVSIPGTMPHDADPRPPVSVHGPATPRHEAPSGQSPGVAGGTTSDPGASGSSPNPSLQGLCTAFQAHAVKGKALESPAFEELVEAAGGTANVEAFCVTILDQDQETSKPKPTQAATGKPTDKGNGKPTDKANGKPATETASSS